MSQRANKQHSIHLALFYYVVKNDVRQILLIRQYPEVSWRFGHCVVGKSPHCKTRELQLAYGNEL